MSVEKCMKSKGVTMSVQKLTTQTDTAVSAHKFMKQNVQHYTEVLLSDYYV